MKILGIITARGGSTRLPGKNIRDFLGKPLLAWTIETALESGVMDRVVLSTDSDDIAEVGKRYGAEVLFKRPAELSTAEAGSLGVVAHASQWLKDNQGYEAPWIMLLEPPSPGRQVFHLKEVAKIIENKNDQIDSLIGVSKMPGHYNPFKAFKLGDDVLMSRWHDGAAIKDFWGRYNNQTMPDAYYNNSMVYAFRDSNLFDAKPSLWGERVYGYLMDYKYSMDIDTEEEWKIAELKMKELL
ncbi:MAG: acylneuraminate cytidylyltransferase family protein [bacterium]|nr:acylneuraminate cytidylyltransferase family protein [bacterium]